MTAATVPARVAPGPGRQRRQGRLLGLMAAGLVDSLILSMAWTVIVLQVTRTHGLVGAGVVSTAMLIGVALSAPFAAWLASRLPGRRLLRVAAATEAVLRLSVFSALALGLPIQVLAACVVAMNVVAWTGYAAMRAEVAAVSQGAVAITWYATVVASVEAAGVALAAVLPVSGAHVPAATWWSLTVVYVLGLLPTVLVAGGSRVPRGPRVRRVARAFRTAAAGRPPLASVPVLVGTGLMLVASAPPMLAVALAAQLHGPAAVGLGALAFTAGSLLSPVLAGQLHARTRNVPTTWVLLAVGVVSGWALAPLSVWWLCVAQLFSGLCMTSLEGLIDSYAADRRPGEVTATLARTTAGRALGSAASVAIFPAAVITFGLSTVSLALGGGLIVALAVVRAVGRR